MFPYILFEYVQTALIFSKSFNCKITV